MKRTLAVVFIERRRVLFEETLNGIHALAAESIAVHFGVTVPDWVRDYTDHSHKQVLRARSMKEMAAAFGLESRGGPFATSRAQTEERNLAIVFFVNHLKGIDLSNPHSDDLDPALRDELILDGPFAVAGRRFNLSEKHVEDIYNDPFPT